MCADGSLFEGMTRVLLEVKSERDRLRAEVWRLTQENGQLHRLADHYRNRYREQEAKP